MAKYITVDIFKKHSYISPEANEDEYLDHLLRTAEGNVQAFLQRDLSKYTDADGSLPDDISHAILLRAATLYENREPDAAVQMRPVSGTYYELLVPYRNFGQFQDL